MTGVRAAINEVGRCGVKGRERHSAVKGSSLQDFRMIREDPMALALHAMPRENADSRSDHVVDVRDDEKGRWSCENGDIVG